MSDLLFSASSALGVQFSAPFVQTRFQKSVAMGAWAQQHFERDIFDMETSLLVGTKKGLFILHSPDRVSWKTLGPFQPGREVNHAIYDARTKRIFATANDAWFGSEVVYTDDWGANWTSATQGPGFPKDSGQTLERLWHLQPGAASEPDVVYCGIAPASIFRSNDRGATWAELPSLANHETRKQWFPGAGGLCLHSIQVDPANPRRIYAGISAAGVFRTDDGGETWAPLNKGTRAEFMPDKYPVVGQCVHKLKLSPADGKTLYQQNHCGVYRSTDDGANWTEITAGLPSDFGFPIGVHPHNRDTIFVLPLKGGEFRCPPDAALRVWRSRDGGATWTALTNGLPQTEAFMGNYRESMDMDKHASPGIYFGTNTGKLFCSLNEGDAWTLIADNLPPIFSVSAAEAVP